MALASQREMHRQADRFEPKVRRAFFRAAIRLRRRVSRVRLAEAISERNTAKAVRIVDEIDFEKVFDPLGGILEDTFVRGGKTGAKLL